MGVRQEVSSARESIAGDFCTRGFVNWLVRKFRMLKTSTKSNLEFQLSEPPFSKLPFSRCFRIPLPDARALDVHRSQRVVVAANPGCWI